MSRLKLHRAHRDRRQLPDPREMVPPPWTEEAGETAQALLAMIAFVAVIIIALVIANWLGWNQPM